MIATRGWLAAAAIAWMAALASPWPWVRVVLPLGAFAALASVAWLRLRVTRTRHAPSDDPAPTRWPFVSVHVPICNEPPQLVRETLAGLAALDYPRFEVVVLDNNTSDRSLWEPISDACRELGPRFRFEHVARLDGFKAGALNRCLSMSRPEAELCFVVDADYIVTPDALRIAVRAADGRPGTAYVQFPQAYRNVGAGTAGLAGHYRHYFSAVMPTADALGAPLLTGTLCLVRIRALEALGGWSDVSLTEDAQLGLELLRAGYRGRYVDRVIGRGLMPTTLSALRAQRRRWVFGNAQTLATLRLRDLRALGPRRSLAVLLQLTAWFEPGLIVWAAVIASLGAALFGGPPAWPAIAASGGLVAAWWVFPWLWKWAASGDALEALRARTIAAALSWEASTAWLEAWLGVRLPFVRTDKAGGASRWVELGPVALVAAVFVGLAANALFGGHLISAALAAACAPVVIGAVRARRELASAEGERRRRARRVVPLSAPQRTMENVA